MGQILVVDDEPSICWGFREFLSDEGHDVSTASSAEDALELLADFLPDAVILDVRLPGMDGLSAIEHFRARLGPVPIIVITAFGNLQSAVRAVEQGAFDYLAKPFELNQAADVVRRALERPRSDVDAPENEGSLDLPDDEIVGTSLPMQQVFKQIALAASSDVPVLLTGESGTGKELAARAIHRHSSRAAGPFIPVCVAALSPTIVESELFGHVRGAFTGAEQTRIGLLEQAAGGTILLDEIGDIPPALQVKLLRAIERREILPVGESRARRVDFRVIAATNRPLLELMQQGEFREDLYFRVSAFEIPLPPLRDRPDDIPLLAAHFLACLGGELAHKRLSEASLAELRQRTWRGNVRELENTIERAAIVGRGDTIHPEHLPPPVSFPESESSSVAHDLRRLTSRWAAEALSESSPVDESDLYARYLACFEPALLEQVMEHCRQNRTEAARLLGLHRTTLREKLRRINSSS